MGSYSTTEDYSFIYGKCNPITLSCTLKRIEDWSELRMSDLKGMRNLFDKANSDLSVIEITGISLYL